MECSIHTHSSHGSPCPDSSNGGKGKIQFDQVWLSHNFHATVYLWKVYFPFLVLLVSGGHCLLAVAKNVDEFLLLGESVDSAPGEVLDKVWFTYSYRTNIKTNYMFYLKNTKGC